MAIARTTRDLDLGLSSGKLEADELLEVLQDSASRDVGDYFVFTIGDPSMDLDGAPYGGSRYPVVADLDGRQFARFHLDVGMGDVQREPYEWIEPREWLGFAGMNAGKFPSISREEHFAQKIHAYTRHRGERTNTRVKDLVDLVLLIEAGGLDHSRLVRDVDDTFQRRQTHEVPKSLEPPPEFWSPVFAKLAAECEIDGDIGAQFEKLQKYWQAVSGDVA